MTAELLTELFRQGHGDTATIEQLWSWLIRSLRSLCRPSRLSTLTAEVDNIRSEVTLLSWSRKNPSPLVLLFHQHSSNRSSRRSLSPSHSCTVSLDTVGFTKLEMRYKKTTTNYRLLAVKRPSPTLVEMGISGQNSSHLFNVTEKITAAIIYCILGQRWVYLYPPLENTDKIISIFRSTTRR